MKICRFDDRRLGLVEGDEVVDVSAALDALRHELGALVDGLPPAAVATELGRCFRYGGGGPGFCGERGSRAYSPPLHTCTTGRSRK